LLKFLLAIPLPFTLAFAVPLLLEEKSLLNEAVAKANPSF
jgi:hypothetical protein